MSILLPEVFGVSAKPVRSYIVRDAVDDKFTAALESDRQIVVYGSSKQGKTALVSKYLPYKQNIVVSLTPRTNVIDIYNAILRQLDIRIETAAEESSATQAGVATSVGFKAFVPFLGGGDASVKTEAKSTGSEKTAYEEVPFNLELPQDVAELIHRVRDSIVVILENFHYLDDNKQQQFAFDLRTFQELGVQFVILGVWREKNRLIQFNGDLLDRVTEVPVEPWTESEFELVAGKGATELNITLCDQLIKKCSDASFASIGVFQELLKEVCQLAGICEAGATILHIEDLELVDRAIETKAEQYAARHQRALESIAAGNVSTSSKDGLAPLFLPYYLIKVLLDAGYDGIASGMRRATIQERIRAEHHRGEDVRGSDMSNLLHNLAKLQANKNITPPIIDYDRTSKLLQLVDSTFYFFLRHADLERISEEIPNPLDE